MCLYASEIIRASVHVSAFMRLPGVCRCCIMAGSISESARVTQRITAAWSQLRKKDCERTREKWQLCFSAIILADRNVVEEISFTWFKVLSSLLMNLLYLVILFFNQKHFFLSLKRNVKGKDLKKGLKSFDHIC